NDGQDHMIQQEPTDTTAENLKIYDIAGASKEIYDVLKGKIIKQLQIQCSDGSILTNIEVKQDGRLTHLFLGGERIANGPEIYNLDIDVNIPVDDNTVIQITTGD
ncbi:MAG: hypothetical protein U9R75_12455, partial [Candidatus Thermoplasmatota archaeon]|nr:hypothetical protein [Candidatus Thermoplasmatota archaeon]